MTKRTYDFLMRLALVYLPAVGALYFGIDLFRDLPAVQVVVGVIVVLDTLLGFLLESWKKANIGADRKYDGVLDLNPDNPGFRVDLTLEEITEKRDILLQVKAENVPQPTPE